MDQITVRYLVNGTVCTDVLLGTMASIQFMPDYLRVKLAVPGLLIRDWAPEPTPILVCSYKHAEICYLGPAEKKYLDVA